MNKKTWEFSRETGRFRAERALLFVLIIAAGGFAFWNWLQENPGHNPWAPLDLRDEPGWTTLQKIVALRDDPGQCRAVLERSAVSFTTMEPAGQGDCRRVNRTKLENYPLSPAGVDSTCAVAVGLEIWLEQTIQPAAREIYGQEVAQIDHLGTYSCRRLYGASDGPWSEHATANAIDIAAFVLEDGSRISLLNNWHDQDDDAVFLRRVRDGACQAFGTVLSPDYNAAHRDHFHLDQKGWGVSGVCR